jgi:hypothetical protein
MFGSDILGVLIGLTLLYFLLSTIVSGISEVIEAFLSRRALYLEAGIAELIGKELKEELYAHPTVRALQSTAGPPRNPTDRKRPVIAIVTWLRSLFRRSPNAKKSPSYVSASTFSGALQSIFTDSAGRLATGIEVDTQQITVKPFGSAPSLQSRLMLGNEVLTVVSIGPSNVWTVERGDIAGAHAEGTPIKRVRSAPPSADEFFAGIRTKLQDIPSEDIRDALLDHLNTAAGNLDSWRKNVEKWFDDKMDRVSGWYKRRTKPILFLIGLVLVVVLNADTIYISQSFWREPALRDSVTAAAQALVEASPQEGEVTPTVPEACKEGDTKDPVACVKEQLESLEELGLPLGWPSWAFWRWSSDQDLDDDARVPHNAGQTAAKLGGLLLTALALTLGAPFWFDLMNKFINFRSSGAPPKKQEDSGSAPGGGTATAAGSP